MTKGIPGATDGLRNRRFYHGTRAELRPGDLIGPDNYPPVVGERDRMAVLSRLTTERRPRPANSRMD